MLSTHCDKNYTEYIVGDEQGGNEQETDKNGACISFTIIWPGNRQPRLR